MKSDLVALDMENDDFALYVYGGWNANLPVFELPRFEALRASNLKEPICTPLAARGTLDFCLDVRRALAA